VHYELNDSSATCFIQVIVKMTAAFKAAFALYRPQKVERRRPSPLPLPSDSVARIGMAGLILICIAKKSLVANSYDLRSD
jgi:hypothetical protein